MAWNSNFRKGTDLPTWDWLSFNPVGASNYGASIAYDNQRYVYYLNTGSTAGNSTTGTSTLYRYDTWSDGWQLLIGSGINVGASGCDLMYDSARNFLWFTNGGAVATVTWQGLNLNPTAVTVLGTVFQPLTATSMTGTNALTTGAGPFNGGSLAFVEDAGFGEPFASGTTIAGSTTSSLVETLGNSLLNGGYVGCAVRLTSGASSGSRRTISAITVSRGTRYTTRATGAAAGTTITVDDTTNLAAGMTVVGTGIGYNAYITNITGKVVTLSVANAFAVSSAITCALDTVTTTLSSAVSSLAVGDTFVIEYPTGNGSTATTQNTGSTATFAATTITESVAIFTTNQYRDCDVLIISGTGAGQRRRIASNTTTVITLETLNTGSKNPTAGFTTFSTDSVYKILPPNDFIYQTTGSGTATFYRNDLSLTAATAWVAPGGATLPVNVTGGSMLHYGKEAAPFSLFFIQGGTNAPIYRYDIGTRVFTRINPSLGAGSTSYLGTDLPSTGSQHCILYDNNRMALLTQGTTRLYGIRLSDGFVEPLGTLPYIAPSAFDGRKMLNIRSLDGVNWLYFMRAGGGEFYRCALEWY